MDAFFKNRSWVKTFGAIIGGVLFRPTTTLKYMTPRAVIRLFLDGQ
jgi:hypothetical protein